MASLICVSPTSGPATRGDKGAFFLIEPLPNPDGREWRGYMRDPDGSLIEVGQYTQLALDWFIKTVSLASVKREDVRSFLAQCMKRFRFMVRRAIESGDIRRTSRQI